MCNTRIARLEGFDAPPRRCHPLGAIGVVDIAASLVSDEDMVGLGDGTRRAMAATRSFQPKPPLDPHVIATVVIVFERYPFWHGFSWTCRYT